jgi:hypothetical protein
VNLGSFFGELKRRNVYKVRQSIMRRTVHAFAQARFAFSIQAENVERIIPFSEADRKL